MKQTYIARMVGITFGSLLTLLIFTTLFTSESHATERPTVTKSCRLYPETGKLICGGFLQYWQQHGGAQRIGRPLSNTMLESASSGGRTYTNTVQYFDYVILRAPISDPTVDQILQMRSTPDYFRRRYPVGQSDASIFLEYPPRVADAKMISIERDDSPPLLQGVVMTYSTTLEPDAVIDFYIDVMRKNDWKCIFLCNDPHAANSDTRLEFCFGCDQGQYPEQVTYHMRVGVDHTNPILHTVLVSVYRGLENPEGPVLINPAPTAGETVPHASMPKTGQSDTAWVLLIVIVVVLTLFGVAARRHSFPN